MVFGIIILVLVAGIAFFHYLQGFFSSMISATITVLAALVAVSYHEPVGWALFGSTIPSYATATALVGLFALTYVFARLLTDRLVPGNVRLPVIADKIGGAAFGVVAGIFGAGILALTAQLLPIGASIAGYARYALVDRDVYSVKVPGTYKLQDLSITGELKGDTIEAGQSSGLTPIPADDLLLGTVQYLSNGGSLAGDLTLTSVHPSYLDELFAHRLGPYKGGDVIVDHAAGAVGLSVGAIYNGKTFLSNPEDFELKGIRGDRVPVITVSEDTVPVVVRLVLEPMASTASPLNPASVHLVVPDKKENGQVVSSRDYYPVGSVQRGEAMLMVRPDDVLFPGPHKPIDFMFMVEKGALEAQEGNKLVLPAGTFIEAKRGARASLAGKEISEEKPTDSADVGIIEKDKSQQK